MRSDTSPKASRPGCVLLLTKAPSCGTKLKWLIELIRLATVPVPGLVVMDSLLPAAAQLIWMIRASSNLTGGDLCMLLQRRSSGMSLP